MSNNGTGNWATIARWQLAQAKALLAKPAHLETQKPRLLLVERVLHHLQTKHPSVFRQDRARLWEDLSRVYFRHGNISRTEHCLRQMAALQPGCADAYLNLGYYLTEMGVKDKALQVYWEGLRVNPTDQYIIYNLAELYRSTGRQQLALKMLDEAITASKDPAILQKAKGDLLREWGHSGMATWVYELALQQLGQRWPALRLEVIHSLADCYQANHEPTAAMHAWERSLELNGNQPEALLNLTRLHYQLQQWKETISYGQRLLAGDRENREVGLLVDRSYQALGLDNLAQCYSRQMPKQHRAKERRRPGPRRSV